MLLSTLSLVVAIFEAFSTFLNVHAFPIRLHMVYFFYYCFISSKILFKKLFHYFYFLHFTTPGILKLQKRKKTSNLLLGERLGGASIQIPHLINVYTTAGNEVHARPCWNWSSGSGKPIWVDSLPCGCMYVYLYKYTDQWTGRIRRDWVESRKKKKQLITKHWSGSKSVMKL